MLARALMGGEIEEYVAVCSGMPGHPKEAHPAVFQIMTRLEIPSMNPGKS